MVGRKKTVTLKDVAAEAGVSLGMASRVLGGYGSFSEKTRAAVMMAAQKLDYRANGVARSLRLNRTRAIGVMISEIVSYHWTVFVQGVEEAARQAGYHVILCNTADNVELEQEYLNDMRERGVDGVIASPVAENYKHFSRLAATGFPLVLVNARIPGTEIPRILSDDRQAATDAVDHLVGLGHGRIGLVAGLPELETARNRLEGYRGGLVKANLPFDESLVAYGNYRQDDAYWAVSELMALTNPPTALLVCSEIMTGAALKCLKDAGISIPGQVSLIGFDDPAWAAFFTPAITTLREQRFYMGRLACDTLVAGIQGRRSDFRQPDEIMLRTELVVRESCMAPPIQNARSVRRTTPSSLRPAT